MSGLHVETILLDISGIVSSLLHPSSSHDLPSHFCSALSSYQTQSACPMRPPAGMKSIKDAAVWRGL